MEIINDEFEQFSSKIVKIHTEGHKLPLFGKLVGLSEQFLTIERKDARRVLIKRRHVLSIEPTRVQPEAI